MASSLSSRHVPTGEGPSIVKLPEHVDGFIDLEILVDIHKCLSESKFDDDRALGVWIKANYLQEPLNLLEEIVRPVRDAEGFVNLDKAYRRARQLTGKAQDKWPFFNRNLRKLSSALVKNAILSDAIAGTVRSEGDEVRDTPRSNGFDGHYEKALQKSGPQASLSANNLSRHQALELQSTQPADRLLDQQGNGQNTLRQDHSFVSKTSSETDNTGLDGTANGTPSSLEAMRDAGAGKVRGPNGRYMNKDDSTPPAKRKPNIKYVKKSRTRATLEGESEEIDESSDDEVEEQKRHSRAASTSSESGEKAPQDSSEPPANAQSAATTPTNLSISAILAAEAEAVPSNLDRLPPGLTHKKRKSDSSIPRGAPKRARGSRGGVLGRPRKSETLADRAKSEPEDIMEVEPPTSQPETPASAPTRRSSRKSAASALESSTPWDPTDDVLFSGTSQKQSARNSTIVSVNGTSKAPGSAKDSKISDDGQRVVDISRGFNHGASTTTPPKPSETRADAQKTPAPIKQKKRVSFSPETQVEKDAVEFFARITTAAGTQEVPLLREDLTHEVDLVERYAEWQLAGNASVSFEVFKNIVKFARPG